MPLAGGDMTGRVHETGRGAGQVAGSPTAVGAPGRSQGMSGRTPGVAGMTGQGTGIPDDQEIGAPDGHLRDRIGLQGKLTCNHSHIASEYNM